MWSPSLSYCPCRRRASSIKANVREATRLSKVADIAAAILRRIPASPPSPTTSRAEPQPVAAVIALADVREPSTTSAPPELPLRPLHRGSTTVVGLLVALIIPQDLGEPRHPLRRRQRARGDL
jgi:hypothetical protein